MLCVVLKLYDGDEKFMGRYNAQIATVQDFDSLEDAACCNVGSYPDYDERGKPYRTVVIPFEHWHEFDVHGESVKGQRGFKAYPVTETADRSIRTYDGR